MDVHVKFGDSGLNMDALLDSLPAAPVLCTFMQYLVAFCSRPEAASDVMSSHFVRLIVPNKCVKMFDPCLNSSQEI